MNFDTQSQNFWKESVEKEAQVRLAWHLQYSKEFSRGNYKPRPRKPTMVPIPTRLPKTILAKPMEKAREENAETRNSKQSSPSALLTEMRPASSGTKKLLYTGLSAEGEGRRSYLQARKTKKPEQKYEYPLTNAWLYGWKISDIMRDVKPSRFGRTKIVRDSFYRENSIF
jgi:hypothetical protein